VDKACEYKRRVLGLKLTVIFLKTQIISMEFLMDPMMGFKSTIKCAIPASLNPRDTTNGASSQKLLRDCDLNTSSVSKCQRDH
jgi:hypothetical protein